jgi:hypothetical protein
MDSVTELSEEVVAMGSHMFGCGCRSFRSSADTHWRSSGRTCRRGHGDARLHPPGDRLLAHPQPPPGPVIASVIIGGFVGALFFSSRHHVFGPTSSISLIVAATIAANSAIGLPPLQLAIYLAFLIGVIQLLAGLLNFGEITKFISRSVVVAYSTGIGILLIASQLHNLLGYNVEIGQNFSTNVLAGPLRPRHRPGLSLGDRHRGLTFAIFWLVRKIRPGHGRRP